MGPVSSTRSLKMLGHYARLVQVPVLIFNLVVSHIIMGPANIFLLVISAKRLSIPSIGLCSTKRFLATLPSSECHLQCKIIKQNFMRTERSEITRIVYYTFMVK
ncbi:hypothetical protein A359_03770 [secondary endosymbiont of Ctenarytaina eucalypti]|uniref:Uncharacterized protein n=1 Tax=secondary endosymbiont of Ctenarytaina eucalypti TaxID=1199245 RepID=J3VS13_9ENTR|nr:hypothetical protein A359_03770 [secondary endosymbiont of Ctenarytaina eucalypti]